MLEVQSEQSPAKRVKFHIEFAVMMINCGREELANESIQKALAILEEMED